ncbi:MAG: NlpC/P60 family protein [Actinomycetes bacterium]
MSRFHTRQRWLAPLVTTLIVLPLILSAVVSLAPSSASAATSFRPIGLHDSGPRVPFVQRVLDIPQTGTYNIRTRKAVKSFQHHRGLIDSGVVRLRTWNALQKHWDRVRSVRIQERRALNAKYDRIRTVARNQFGDPYAYGAAGPSAFDCSGYTMYVYAKATGINLPHSASAQASMGRHITRAQARPGDLVFFSSGGVIYHAAIYAGHGAVFHAPHSGTVVQRDPIWSSSVTFERLLHP